MDDSEDSTELVNSQKDYSNPGRIHREIKTSNNNGFQTIEITEVHVGRRPISNDFNGMPLSGIIISKPKNLKGKSTNSIPSDDFAMPYHMFKSKDYLFNHSNRI